MKPERGVSLVEIVVAGVIVAMVIAGVLACYVSIKQLSKELVYRYTALNLAREILEWGAAGTFIHGFGVKYYYPAATSNTIPVGLGCFSNGIDRNLVGYGVKEWRCFRVGSSADPFIHLGNIKAKGLVPKGAPDSVEIHYYVRQDAGFYNAFRQTVEVRWKEEVGQVEKKEVLSVIPIRTVNNQLTLTTAEFWWE
jgi:hypothetical protein